MTSIKVNLFWNTLNTLGRLGISFIATIVLSRLLTPQDFGMWGILAIFISLSELLSDSGMGGYIIKKQRLDSIDYNTLFVYNLIISILLYILIFILAPYIAEFYSNNNVVAAIRIAFLAVIFQALGITPTNKLLKEMRFKDLAVVSIISGIISFIIAIIIAYQGYGYWSLIYQHVLATLFASIGVYFFSHHVPKLQFSLKSFKEQFGFGINLMGGNVLNSLSTNISNNVIGKYFSLTLTGFYTQASKLQGISTSMISGIVDKTFFPHFAKFNDNLDMIHDKGYELSHRMYAYCFPLFLIVIFFANILIDTFLGANWSECTPILRILMLASFPALGKAMNRNILKSMGYTHSIFLIELFSTIFLLTGLCFAILSNSFFLIVIAFVIVQYISFGLSIYFLVSKLAFNFKKLVFSFLEFSPLVIFPLVIGSIYGLNYKIFLISFIPVMGIYILCGVKEYRIK